jgi:hypothetical protein
MLVVRKTKLNSSHHVMAAGGAAAGTAAASKSVGATFMIPPQLERISLAQTRHDVLAIAVEAWLRSQHGYAEATEPPGLLRLKQSRRTEDGVCEFVLVIRKGGRRSFSNSNREELQRSLKQVRGVSEVQVEAIELLTEKGKWDKYDAGPGDDLTPKACDASDLNAEYCCGNAEHCCDTTMLCIQMESVEVRLRIFNQPEHAAATGTKEQRPNADSKVFFSLPKMYESGDSIWLELGERKSAATKVLHIRSTPGPSGAGPPPL